MKATDGSASAGAGAPRPNNAESLAETAAETLRPGLLRRHAWKVGGTLAIVTLGGLWWRRRRRRKQLDPGNVTEGWLMEHEYSSGQRSSDT